MFGICRPRAMEVNGEYVNVQAAVYSGHKKVHNFLFLVMMDAFGLVMSCFGPHIGRDPDTGAYKYTDTVK